MNSSTAMLLVAVYLGLNFIGGLWAGSMYPLGPGWFPIRRDKRPIAFWAVGLGFLMFSLAFFASWAGVMPGYSV